MLNIPQYIIYDTSNSIFERLQIQANPIPNFIINKRKKKMYRVKVININDGKNTRIYFPAELVRDANLDIGERYDLVQDEKKHLLLMRVIDNKRTPRLQRSRKNTDNCNLMSAYFRKSGYYKAEIINNIVTIKEKVK